MQAEHDAAVAGLDSGLVVERELEREIKRAKLTPKYQVCYRPKPKTMSRRSALTAAVCERLLEDRPYVSRKAHLAEA